VGFGAGIRRVLGASVLVVLAAAQALFLRPAPSLAQTTSLRVIDNGERVTLRGDAIVQNGLVMAPFQGLSEPLGIRTTWDAATQTLTLVGAAGDEMQLRPNDPYATVNGERRPIPIPLVTVFGRVLIPVEWVFNTLGLITHYDPGARTLTISAQITGITWQDSGASLDVHLDGTAPLHAQASRLFAPDRIVIDVTGAVATLDHSTIDVHEGPLSTIAVAASASGTRIVLTLVAPTAYRLRGDAGDRQAMVSLLSRPQSAPPEPAAAGEPRITAVAYQPMNGGGRLVVTSSAPVQFRQHVLRRPDRVVLDADNAVFIPVKQAIDVNDGLVAQVRAAQFHKAPDVVRIVVELARPTAFVLHAGADATQTLLDLGTATAAAAAPGNVSPSATGPRGPVVVAIDPGHGGSDPGATGPNGVREKDVVLAIAQDLRALLAQQHIETVMIRDSDVFVPLEDRAVIAQRGGATVFISIHANASVDPNAQGTQAFYFAPQSVPLAQAVLDEVSRATSLIPRGVTQARFEVLVDNAKIPAILVETAFVTNPHEEQVLKDPSQQQLLAQGIFRGLQRYLAVQQSAAP
jgi:N-acetylmuramoyl-L-alanine amidase